MQGPTLTRTGRTTAVCLGPLSVVSPSKGRDEEKETSRFQPSLEEKRWARLEMRALFSC
jgi:hypothetical protein